MAGADGPDPRAFNTWEDAFKHPIPAVRGMEKKLRAGANENQEKLKTLVGVSYRELLGTAHTIVDANTQIRQVESLLVNVGRRCDSRILNKIASNQVRLQSSAPSKDKHQNCQAAQLFLLQQCLKTISRLLRTHGSTLLTAKLLVVSRLLHKVLSTSPDESQVNALFGKRLVSLRTKLLRHLDRRFERFYTDLTELVLDMTAFALATSSGPLDVLKHYQYVRLETIKKSMRNRNQGFKEAVIANFRLYISTQREIRAIYPELLQGSLRNLGTRAILEDPEVRQIDDLRLDSHLPWISPEVSHFKPWTRYEEAEKSKLTPTLRSWSKASLDIFISQLSVDIGEEFDLEILVALRTELLQSWLTHKRYTAGLNARQVLSRLRAPFTSRIKDLISESFLTLYGTVTELVSSSLQDWQHSAESMPTLWHLSILPLSISNGASSFRETVVNRRSGRNETILKVLHDYHQKAKDIQSFPPIIQQMREVRWEDDGELSDSDEEDAEFENGTVSQILSQEDPNELQKSLKSCAASFVQQLEEFFSTKITDENMDCTRPISPGLFILRVIRELRRNIPVLLQTVDKDAAAAAEPLICSNLTANLYSRLAEAISDKISPVFQKALDSYIHSRGNPKALWEGSSPPLPIQITPALFHTLRAAVKEMEALGSDLWAPGAAKALRTALDHSFSQTLTDALAKLENLRTTPIRTSEMPESPKANGTSADDHERNGQSEDVEVEPSEEVQTSKHKNSAEMPEVSNYSVADDVVTPTEAARDEEVKAKLLQLLFDNLYLSNALSTPPSGTATTITMTTDAEADLQAKQSVLEPQTVQLLVSKTGVDDAALARLQKSAADYWRKTYLLFGLLCG